MLPLAGALCSSWRILPVLSKAIGSLPPPPRLSALNYVRFDEGRSFISGLRALARALETDVDWLREHTRLLSRAQDWNSAGRPGNRLLSGRDIEDARAWIARRPPSAPEPTSLHLDFIAESGRAEADRNNSERLRLEQSASAETARAQALNSAEIAQRERAEALSRLVRRTAIGLMIAVALAVAATGTGLYALWKRNEAETARRDAETARSDLSLQQSQLVRAAEGYRSQISAESYRASGALVQALEVAEKAVEAFAALSKEAPNAVAWRRDLAASLTTLGDTRLARGELPLTLQNFQAALAIREALAQRDPEQPATRRDLATVHSRIGDALLSMGRYEDSARSYSSSIEILEAVGAQGSADFARALSNLATVHRARGNYVEAERLLTRGLPLLERSVGAEHLWVSGVLNNLAELYQAQGRYADAEPIVKRALLIREQALPTNHPDIATSVNSLANLYRALGRFADAEALHRRGIAVREKVLGSDHPDVAASLNNLAMTFVAQGRYVEAEEHARRSLQIRIKVIGPDHPDVATSLGIVAGIAMAQAKYGQAEALYRQSLQIRERVLGPDHPDVGSTLNSLATLYDLQGDYARSESLHRRTITMMEKSLGASHPTVAAALADLAELYQGQRNFTEAEALLKRSLGMRESALGPEHPEVAQSLAALGNLLVNVGRAGEAEPILSRGLAIREKALGSEHPEVAQSLAYIGNLYRAQQRYGDTETVLRRSMSIRERGLGPEHPESAASMHGLASVYFEQSRWADASRLWHRSINSSARHARGFVGAQRLKTYQRGFAKASYRAATHDQAGDARWKDELFQVLQWQQGASAASSLAEMGARQMAGGGALAALVRERQDLTAARSSLDTARAANLLKPSDKRDAAAESQILARLVAIDARQVEIERRLAAEFPQFEALASPAPVAMAEVQSLLGPAEALVFLLDTPDWGPAPEETFVWVITKTEGRLIISKLGTKSLTTSVAALRCGLYGDAWSGNSCAGAKSTSYSSDDYMAGKALPFDQARSHEMYRALLGDAEDLIRGRSLLIVASGPLGAFPFSALVTAPQRWLVHTHAIAMLPDVSSLKALRLHAKRSAATQSFVGFGNPLLDGSEPYSVEPARAARQKLGCQGLVGNHSASNEPSAAPGGFPRAEGLADTTQLRRLVPLPETADELCVAARSIGADADAVYLGARATERTVKTLSASGRLADYKIVYFATHGVSAGDIAGVTEPGLILTPPAQAGEDDDGYLAASEIAGLRMDADWVILSASNSAGGARTDGEVFSGIAKAFFYAGTRSLLVAHGDINSEGTGRLITKAVEEIARDPVVRPAEALRRAMLRLIEGADPHLSHPSAWAPFVVVGEGAPFEHALVPAPPLAAPSFGDRFLFR